MNDNNDEERDLDRSSLSECGYDIDIDHRIYGSEIVLSEKSDSSISNDVKNIRVTLQEFKCCPFCGEKPILTVSDSEIVTNVRDELLYSIYGALRVKCPNCRDVSMRSERVELVEISASEVQLCMFGIKDLKDKWNQRKN